jgi:hypothetical protein
MSLAHLPEDAAPTIIIIIIIIIIYQLYRFGNAKHGSNGTDLVSDRLAPEHRVGVVPMHDHRALVGGDDVSPHDFLVSVEALHLDNRSSLLLK